MTQVRSPQCLNCGWYRFEEDYKGKPPSCDVFPEGIPDPIWNNEAWHSEPYPGDGGVTSVPMDPDIFDEIQREQGL